MKVENTARQIVLSENAMFASLHIGQFSNVAKDRKLSRDLCREHGASDDAGKVMKQFFSRRDLAGITGVVSQLRSMNYHYTFELPKNGNGQSRGPRLLPTRIAEEYLVAMHELRDKFDDEVEKFVSNYDAKVDAQRVRLNGMFRESDYPSADYVRECFSVDISITGLPGVKDINVGQFTDEYKAQEAERQAKVVDEVGKQLAKRLHDAVKHLSETMAKDSGKVYDSVFGNVAELIDLIPGCNLGNDEGLQDLANKADALIKRAGSKPSDMAKAVKSASGVRSQIAAEAEALANKASSYF